MFVEINSFSFVNMALCMSFASCIIMLLLTFPVVSTVFTSTSCSSDEKNPMIVRLLLSVFQLKMISTAALYLYLFAC